MADETLSFSIIARDQASSAFRETARSASDLAGKMDTAARMGRVLDETLRKEVRAGDELSRSFAVSARAAGILDDEQKMLRDGALEAEYALKKEAEAAKKSGRAAVEAAAENRTLADSLRKVSDSSFFKPSGMGIAAALSPALIPLAGGIAAGIGAIGVSFGAATIGAGLFGLAAKSVLSTASTNLAKLQALELTLNKATTAAQKKSAQASIAALKATWAPGYLSLIDQLDTFKKTWTKTSQTIAIPALSSWLGGLTKGMPLLVTAVKPVADVFRNWGDILRQNFADPAVMAHLQGMAAAFGKFSAGQLTLVGGAIVNIAKGVFNLGRDLAGSGANFSAAGIWFYNMGAAFLTWSKSAKARADVQGFMHYLHQEGPVVGGILSNLGKILPGIFAGATTTGTLELQAIGGLMSLIAKLPAGWQKPLTEAAGAMLLLSKTGVLSVGLKLAGTKAGAKVISALAGAAPLALPLVLTVAAVEGLNQIKDKTGGGTLVLPKASDLGINGRWAKDINHWLNVALDGIRHGVASAFDWVRHFVSADWDRTWGDAANTLVRGGHDIENKLDGLRHNIANTFDTIRHDIASAWNTIWNNTASQVQHGISDVVGWFRSLPGKILGALRGLGHSLSAFASAALNEMWNGIKSVGGSILGWFGGFVSKIVGFFAKLLHHSPTGEFYYMGKNMMEGLAMGLKDHAHLVANAAKAAVGGIGLGGVVNSSGYAALKSAAAKAGWTGAQWQALYDVEMREAGFSLTAQNPGSGAYGMAQFINGPSEYYQYGGNPGTAAGQAVGMVNYIRQRYGTPAAAWAHELAAGWYGGGLSGGIFSRPTLIGVGERGPERVDVTPVGAARGGGTVININVSVPVTANPRDVARQIADLLKVHVKGGGTLYPAGVTPR